MSPRLGTDGSRCITSPAQNRERAGRHESHPGLGCAGFSVSRTTTTLLSSAHTNQGHALLLSLLLPFVLSSIPLSLLFSPVLRAPLKMRQL